ncbi:hypothetical protein MKX01_020039 [Papaver californicum]|nr:hypothetical protein MKX01_020039 [Papaver californicum]
MHYLKLKQLLMLSYCQAITFYLLLKYEGHFVRDHPVIAHLVEMKYLLDKMLQPYENLHASIEEINNLNQTESRVDILKHTDAVIFEAPKINHKLSSISMKTQEKLLTNQVGKQSMEMLKIRVDLVEKYKQKGMITAPKHDHVISGDDDLPKIDDIGERRRKNELGVLEKCGSMHDDNDDDGDVNEGNPGARKRRRADIEDGDVEAEESKDECKNLCKSSVVFKDKQKKAVTRRKGQVRDV